MMRRAGRAAASVALALPALLLLGACTGGGGAATPGTTDDPGPAPFAIDQDFPDPDVLNSGECYYAYATNSASVNVQVATSKDLETWAVQTTDAMPTLPAWASRGRTWAPDVSTIGGKFVLFFTAADTASGRQCIGVATATDAMGPFESTADRPLVCPASEGGAIDASTFVDDDGTTYLLYKTDGNCCGLPTRIELSRLSADGTRLEGEPTELIRQTESWEGQLVEAPTLVQRDGKYVLFYSANDYGGGSYAVGYASADAVAGPYEKADGPFLSTETSTLAWFGPGGQDVATAPDGTDRLVFHSWDPAVSYRGLDVAPLTWANGAPTLAYPEE